MVVGDLEDCRDGGVKRAIGGRIVAVPEDAVDLRGLAGEHAGV
jgi:hypothetical protein